MKLHYKTPLPLVLGTLANLILVIALEVLVFYRTPLPPTAEFLSKLDPRYENCQVYGSVNTDENRGVRFYRVVTADGETDLIPLKQHSFFPSRTRFSAKKILKDLDLKTDSSQQFLFGTGIYVVSISGGSVRAMAAVYGSFQQKASIKYLVLGLVLTIAELAVWDKLRGS